MAAYGEIPMAAVSRARRRAARPRARTRHKPGLSHTCNLCERACGLQLDVVALAIPQRQRQQRRRNRGLYQARLAIACAASGSPTTPAPRAARRWRSPAPRTARRPLASYDSSTTLLRA